MSSSNGTGWHKKVTEPCIPTLQQHIRDNPLGIMTTHLPNSDAEIAEKT